MTTPLTRNRTDANSKASSFSVPAMTKPSTAPKKVFMPAWLARISLSVGTKAFGIRSFIPIPLACLVERATSE